MNITKACTQILAQLSELIQAIDEKDYIKPSATLGASTIGQHIRHTLEFFICFRDGYASGVINYDKRAHDKLIETDKFIALGQIDHINAFIAAFDPARTLRLEVGYDPRTDESVSIETNAARELVYNIEHAVHHMAIMKIGIREVAGYVKLPPDFGIAASTIRYKQATAVSR